MKANPQLNSNTLHLRTRFFAFVALITVVIISAGLINFYLHATNEKLETANRLTQEQFTALQQVSEKFRFITTRSGTVPQRTLDLIRQDLIRLTAKIQKDQHQLNLLLNTKDRGRSFFWARDIYPSSSRLSETELRAISWLEVTVSNTESFFDSESMHITRPLESAVLLQTPWHLRLIAANEQLNTNIQSNFRITGLVIWATFLGLFSILWMMYYAIIRPALVRLQDAFDQSQSKLELQTALASVLEDVSSRGSHLFDSSTEDSVILSNILHKHNNLKDCDLSISEDIEDDQQAVVATMRYYLTKKLSHTGYKKQTLCIELPMSMRGYTADILPFLTALANHLSALFETRLRMTAESQRDTYFQFADTAINALPTPVVVFDESLHVMIMNPAFQVFFSDLKHSTLSDITLADLAAHNSTLIATDSEDVGEVFVIGSIAEFNVSYANNTSIVWSRLPVNKLGIVFVGHDITTIRDNLTEKEHIHRLKSLGQMSVSVAHDTNNHLSIIMNILEIIGLRTDFSEDRQVLLQEAIHSCRKVSSISRQLVSFTRPQNLIPQTVRPESVEKYVEEFLCEESYKNTLLSVELEDDVCIFCDPDHLRSTILNIVKNSADAMQCEGLITLSIRSLNSYFVRITITDTGPGFSTKDCEHATVPVYTTKDGAAGLVGLAGAHGFARQSNGSLSLQNIISGGATAQLLLPKSHIAMADHWEDKILALNTDSDTKNLSILVTEDNELLSDLMVIEFKQAGHEIYSASTLKRGLEMLESITNLDILITDIILPDGLGFTLAQELPIYFPNCEVIYTTGYGSGDFAAELSKKPGRVLEKPFSILKLINLVQEVHNKSDSNNVTNLNQ